MSNNTIPVNHITRLLEIAGLFFDRVEEMQLRGEPLDPESPSNQIMFDLIMSGSLGQLEPVEETIDNQNPIS